MAKRTTKCQVLGNNPPKKDREHFDMGVNIDVDGPQLSPYRRQELFVAWTHEQSNKYVMETCNVSEPTVIKYKRLDKWDERIALITAGIAEKIDEMLAASLVVQLHEVMVLRQRAYLEAMKGSFKDARQAFQSYVELSKLEKEIKPAPEDGTGDDVLAIARRIFTQRKLKDGAKVVREIAAEVVQGGAKEVADNLPQETQEDESKDDA